MPYATPEKTEELRKIIRELTPFAINIFQGFLDKDPDLIANEFVELMLHADKSGLMD